MTVDYQTVYGEAGAADFIAENGHVTFAAGERERRRSTIEITPDKLVEGNEHFGVVLSNAVGATITAPPGTSTIVDDDTAPTTPTRLPPTRHRPRGRETWKAMFAIVNSWSGELQRQRHARERWRVRDHGLAGQDRDDQPDQRHLERRHRRARCERLTSSATPAPTERSPMTAETSFGFVATGQQDPSTVHIDLLRGKIAARRWTPASAASRPAVHGRFEALPVTPPSALKIGTRRNVSMKFSFSQRAGRIPDRPARRFLGERSPTRRCGA